MSMPAENSNRAGGAVARAAASATLEADVDAVLPVLPVLANQLRETRSQVETAVVQICENFDGIAQRARASVDGAARLLSGDGDGGIDGLITSSHSTLENLLQRIVKGGELSMKAVYRMDDVEVGMQRIGKILSDVNDVATRTRLLTVNAKIEAARVGEQGKGFAVVASEISQLSVKSAEIVVSISEILNKLSADVGATVADLRELASADMSEVLLGKERIELAVQSFETRHMELKERLRDISHASETLADDISGAVIGLQFQDRVSQRIEHVIEGLDTVGRALQPGARGVSGDSGALLDALQGRYTMAEERRAQAPSAAASNAFPSSALPHGSSPSPDTSDDDVVLF